MKKTYQVRAALAAAMLAGGLSGGCGGSDQVPKAQDRADDTDQRGGGAKPIAVAAEIGALDEEQVDETFTKTLGQLQRCLNDGAKRVEFIGGGVAFYVEVDQAGKLEHAHLERSSLGDRKTESCMLEALRSKPWPKPVGGEKGYARKSFEFDPPNDVRPPTEWSETDIAESLGEIGEKLAECKNGSSGSFEATMYVGTEGDVIGVGVTPPDGSGEASVDCLVEALRSATYPSPGSWPAKVTFAL
jgi:hypothetical protein